MRQIVVDPGTEKKEVMRARETRESGERRGRAERRVTGLGASGARAPYVAPHLEPLGAWRALKIGRAHV